MRVPGQQLREKQLVKNDLEGIMGNPSHRGSCRREITKEHSNDLSLFLRFGAGGGEGCSEDNARKIKVNIKLMRNHTRKKIEVRYISFLCSVKKYIYIHFYIIKIPLKVKLQKKKRKSVDKVFTLNYGYRTEYHQSYRYKVQKQLQKGRKCKVKEVQKS